MIEAPALTKGQRTRLRLLEAAESVFSARGYYEASIVEITQAAGVAQGTFYVYFPSKTAVFTELVRTRGTEMRQAMREASSAASSRAGAERAGFVAFLEWVRAHPGIYRIVKQSEWVDVAVFEEWYRKIADGYCDGLRAAAAKGEIVVDDVETVAWALMGAGDLVGMRFAVWDGVVPDHVVDALMAFVRRGLGAATDEPGTSAVDAGRRRRRRRETGAVGQGTGRRAQK
jgi:AcrR family transcriptional regulator